MSIEISRSFVIRTLRRLKIKPRWYKGQVFICDPYPFYRLVNLANVTSSDVVYEIGSGLGFLTSILAQKAKKVISIEIERKFYNFCKGIFKRIDNIELVLGDATKHPVPREANKVVSSIPYSISKAIFLKLVKATNIETIAIICQKEFYEKVTAKPRESRYGYLSILCKMLMENVYKETIPQEYFYPRPKVTSVIAVFKRKKNSPLDEGEIELFIDFLKAIFTYRRKKLKKALKISGIEDVERIDENLLDKPVLLLEPSEALEVFKAIEPIYSS
ncbi:ribosomal RNA small subunit methyltransferase A [archaeon]|nr:MAG: ribosomal RNA small subunit methyltransferase A [archaeon]RLG65698.1 MAG: ribosomal RNA small subunit methyltransferase A [archaeon]HDM23557.1 ribosomal RNA small subunit methyltransferase A [Candidatus Bathyarchaeota archaeon]